MNPTQEQIKEFWEWCGFTHINYIDVAPIRYGEYGKIECSGNYPSIDLNNLFRYAVPKINWWIMSSNVINYTTVEVRIYPEIGIDYKSGSFEGYNDPALALFWAISELIKER